MAEKTIEKKILPKYFEDILVNGKRFELRKDEDDIQHFDNLILKEWDGEQYTGREITCTVLYVLRSVPEYGLADGYCIIGFADWCLTKGTGRIVRYDCAG